MSESEYRSRKENNSQISAKYITPKFLADLRIEAAQKVIGVNYKITSEASDNEVWVEVSMSSPLSKIFFNREFDKLRSRHKIS